MSESPATAVLGGGCFWCLDAVYRGLRGVIAVESGYAGGTVAHPSYEAVCSGRTGHAEVVRVTFDPAKISYGDLLGVFFAIHDPTTRNRQGHDIGTQYRSVVFAQDETQRQTAEALVRRLDAERIFPAPIVTEITGTATFWPAEAYHQDYFSTNAGQPYCQGVVAPKIAKFRRQFVERLKKRPATA